MELFDIKSTILVVRIINNNNFFFLDQNPASPSLLKIKGASYVRAQNDGGLKLTF